jgi:SanA protein
MKKIVKIIIIIILAVCLALAGLMVYVRTAYIDKIYDQISSLPQNSVVVVLGASVKRDQTPSDALEDRLAVAVRAWREGKTEKIILSGDDGQWAQNETQAMLSYVISQGVPDQMIAVDGDNARTYDSCYRLKNELGQDRVVLITQSFHLPRALYLCNKLGLEASGLASDLRPYSKIVWFTVRDWLASLLAFLDVNLHREPSYLQ